ncbi:MAG: pilus assembly protein [Alphaproteobacteria bacterium]|nr:pilus assembly protein [Alphaproteobacteria bacterium]
MRALDTRGATAVEFALLAPVFFIIFLGIFEIGAVMAVQTTLELAVLEVSRFGRTGSVVAGQTAQQTAGSLVSAYSLGLVDSSKVVLTVTPYSSFSAMPLRSQAPTNGSQNFGASNQPVLYTLSYKWNYFTPLVGKLLSSAGSTTLISTAVILNEPF